MSLEKYFKSFRDNTIGVDQNFETPYGTKKIYYADWTASGRMYEPIEKLLKEEIAPFVGNTHTETTVTGSSMTIAYHKAKEIIKNHVGASEHDILISSNSGMTGVVNKFQRILGFKIHEKYKSQVDIPKEDRPVVFVSHMEHHSNQTTWLETICDVEIIKACPEGKCDLGHFTELLEKHKDRKRKIAAVTSCSNVTGVITPYHEIAAMIHRAGGLCFVDFACSAPYIDIDMHPDNPEEKLDAIYFSPHKFLGGPASSGVLLFCQSLYNNKVPDNPGGGTVDWTNPWGEHKYHEAIEAREDGGTPGFIQTIRVALSIKLKEKMGVKNIHDREEELLEKVWQALEPIPNLHILADNIKKRLPVISFYVDDLHFNLAVKLLNDRYGVQVRGGCSCAGTYGHYLLAVSKDKSKSITDSINCGILSDKPGWIRMSLHPIMSDDELDYILAAIKDLCLFHKDWEKDYEYSGLTNEWEYVNKDDSNHQRVDKWFDLELA
jgi:selenocysteine lyase/cysteine desulfurase